MNRFVLLFLFGVSCFSNHLFAQDTEYKLNIIKPIEMGYPSDFFEKLGREANDSIQSLGSILVWRKNGLVYQEYFHGEDERTNFNIKSVTKSVISAITGIALDKGLLPDLNTPVITILSEYKTDPLKNPNNWYPDLKLENDSLIKLLTLKNLLTMKAGLSWTESSPVASAFLSSSDPVRFMLELPFDYIPGQKFNYCSGAAHVMSAVLSKCVKKDLKEFAENNLFKQAGMSIAAWHSDPLGRYHGGAEMFMTAQNMMRFGLLYLHDGKVKDKQVIPSSWIKESTSAQVKLDEWDVLPGANGYGYYWWRRVTNGHQAYIASGFGGQLICVIPDLEMVVVTTCLLNQANRGRSEIKRLHGFIDKITGVSK